MTGKEWLGIGQAKMWEINAFDVIKAQAFLLEVFGGRK